MIDDGNRKHDKYSSSFTKNELHGHTPMCGHMGTSGVQPKDIIIFLYTFYTFRKTLNHFRLFPPSFLLHVPGILFSSLRFSGKTTHTHTTFKKKSWDFAAAAQHWRTEGEEEKEEDASSTLHVHALMHCVSTNERIFSDAFSLSTKREIQKSTYIH